MMPKQPINNAQMNRKIFYRSFIIACLLFALNSVNAQNVRQPLVTVHLKDTSMAEILKELEQQSGLRFYYDTTDLDTTKLSIQADQQPLTLSTDSSMFSSARENLSTRVCRRIFLKELLSTVTRPEWERLQATTWKKPANRR